MSILTKAEEIINGERAKDYGSTLDNFGRIAKMWSAILGVEVTPEQHVLCMVAVKMARLCHSPRRLRRQRETRRSEEQQAGKCLPLHQHVV